MRDVNRLKEIYDTIEYYHSRVPDIRCMQLINNFMSWHYKNYGSDGFYIEDDTFLIRFKAFVHDVLLRS